MSFASKHAENISARDLFAMAAMESLMITDELVYDADEPIQQIAQRISAEAFVYADAMLKARSMKPEDVILNAPKGVNH